MCSFPEAVVFTRAFIQSINSFTSQWRESNMAATSPRTCQWPHVQWKHCSVCVFFVSLIPRGTSKAHTLLSLCSKELGPGLTWWRHLSFWGPLAAMTMAFSRPIHFGSWLESLVLIQPSHLAHVDKIVLDKYCFHSLRRSQPPNTPSPRGKKDDRVGYSSVQ